MGCTRQRGGGGATRLCSGGSICAETSPRDPSSDEHDWDCLRGEPRRREARDAGPRAGRYKEPEPVRDAAPVPAPDYEAWRAAHLSGASLALVS